MHAQQEFGVVVIGDEILSGKRQDRHLGHVIESLRPRGMSIGWYRIVGDTPRALLETLRHTQQDILPVLCFGGIGATPDDNTRQAAAEAFGRPMSTHPEALALIEAQFGAAARPNRVRMAELPEDCLLIPNPINRIPGFTVYEHHFFPGFPEMAWPMLEWVLERYYAAGTNSLEHERSLRVLGVPESELLDVMETLARDYPDARLFSLPHLGEQGSIEIGFRGAQPSVEAALASLVGVLSRLGLAFECKVAV